MAWRPLFPARRITSSPDRMTRTESDGVVCRRDVRRANGRGSAADLAALLISAAVIGPRSAWTYTIRYVVRPSTAVRSGGYASSGPAADHYHRAERAERLLRRGLRAHRAPWRRPRPAVVIIVDRGLARRDEQVLGDHLALTGAGDDRQRPVGVDVQAHLLRR